jgi:hypothetical protein
MERNVRFRHITLAIAACVFSCDDGKRIVADGHVLTEPTQLCREGAGRACREAGDVEALLQRGDLEILAARETSTGVQGAYILTLRTRVVPRVVFRAKWRPDSSETHRNNPRYELAAYALQKQFLEPREYVVPPTATHCFPIATYRARVNPKARGSQCVRGVLSYWLEDVTSVADAREAGWFRGSNDHILDPARFARDRVYRDSIARVNVLTYMIGHRDSHARNFVLARAGKSPVVYSIDNSLSFTMAPNPRIPPFNDWSKLHVPALPRSVVDRLRVASKSSETAGLTREEIAGVRARMVELVRRVDRGELRVY